MLLCVLAAVAFFLPISSGVGVTSFDLSKSFNIVDVISLMLHPSTVTGEAESLFVVPFVMACAGLVLAFLAVIALFLLTFVQANIGVRRVLAVCIMMVTLICGLQFNTTLTSTAKPAAVSEELSKPAVDYYGITPNFKIVMKTRTGSVDKWTRLLTKFQEAAPEVFVNGENLEEINATLEELITYSKGFSYDTKSAENKKGNEKILSALRDMISVDQQEAVFGKFFKNQVKSVNAWSSTMGVGFLLLLVLSVVLSGTCYSEKSKEGYKNNGIRVNCMYVGIMTILLVGALCYPVVIVNSTKTALTGMKETSILMVLLHMTKLFDMEAVLSDLGLSETAAGVNGAQVLAGLLLVVASFACMLTFIVMAAKKKSFRFRRVFSCLACLLFVTGGIVALMGLGDSGISLDSFFFLFSGVAVAAALLPFTAYSDKEKYKVFSIVNVILFLFICAFIVVPLWKVFVDSLDATAGYGMRMWPESFSLQGYKQILTNPAIYKPFLISVVTTVVGTFLGLLLSTLGAYVLIQFEMPGRNFLAAMLLFTMIFQGGMIPTFLVMSKLHLTNTLWAVILLPAINVYNLVLMRNFFEGIPKSLFESASIDGCTPMGTFIKIVLPLSKAALASIGLMFAVSYWNDYTNYKLYITDTSLHNFQMKLRALIMSSDMPVAVGVSENTLQNAAIMVAIIPFMIIYPFCQKYFVKGVNVGAVKE